MAEVPPDTSDYSHRVVTMLDDEDRAALDRLIAAEKLSQADVLRRLIRQAAKVLSQSSAA